MNTYRKNIKSHRCGIIVCILLLTVFLCGAAWFTSPDTAYAMNTGSAIKVGELLSNHYETRADGKAFNRATVEDLLEALGGAGAGLSQVSALGAQTAKQLYDRNGSQDIVVTFGGYEWTVTHLTQDRNNNTIVTLWRTQSSDMSKFNLWESSEPGTYPSNMYSTSYLRASALNSGGCGYIEKYGDTTLTQEPQSASHPYARFTMGTVNDANGNNMSLTQYLIRPRDVAYQETETIVALPGALSDGWYTCQNEGYGVLSTERYSQNDQKWNYSETNANGAKPHYTDWADDYLWLPSVAETGYASLAGIWALSNNQLSNGSNSMWVRTSDYYGAQNMRSLSASGGKSYTTVQTTQAVRPALHLNLTKAVADVSDPIDAPTLGASQSDRVKAYNGAGQTFALSDYDAADMQIVAVSGKDPAGNAIAGDVSFDPTVGTATAKHAGTYRIEVGLTDSTTSFWTSGDDNNGKREYVFTITPKQLTLALDNDVPSGVWSWSLQDAYTATVTASGIESGDTIGMHAIYTDKTSGVARDVAGVQTGADIVATVDLSKIAIGEYTMSAALDNSVGQSINYSISNGLTSANMPMPFTVRHKRADLSAAQWLYTAYGPSGNPIPDGAKDTQIVAGTQIAYALFGTLSSYGAVRNELRLDKNTLPKDANGNPIADIDMLTTSYNGTTYTGGYSNASGTAVNRYTTKVLLKIVDADYLFDNNQTTYELSLSWEIVKGTFDLSGVQWEYRMDNGDGGEYLPDTELEYDDGKIIRVAVKESSLPLGLTVLGGLTYQGNANVQTAVGTYTATVDTGLDYDTSLFEAPGTLQLTWEIVGKSIRTKWKSKVHNDYFVVELNIDPAYAGMVHYRYYDASNNLLGADAAGLAAMDQMIAAQGIGPSNPQNFTIEAYLDGADSGNYRLVGDVRKTVTVGLPLTQVRVDVAGSVTYDGNAHYGDNELTFTGANIRPSDYTATYYAGTDLADMSKNTKLDGAPTDAGKYVIAIEMQGTSYLLSQDVFAVEILPKQVAVPTLKAVTFNGTEYRLLDLLTGFDADVMTMDDVTAATNAGTYRATLTLSSKNYVWATADGATGSQEYELSWTIAKAQLKEQWVGQADGKQTFVVSDKYADYVQIVYEYYDADGNIVAESDLVAGQTYKVVAKLGAASAENFEFIDANGDVTTVPSQSEAKQFVFGNDPNNPSGSGNFGIGESWFKIAILTMTVCIVLITLMLFAIWMAVLSIRRLRKNKSQQS